MGGMGRTGYGRAHASRRGSFWRVAPLALAALLLLPGCSTTGSRVSFTPVASPTETHVLLPTSTPAPTVIAITDLTTFRTSLAAAFAGGKWAPLAALMSPSFTFQGTNTGGAQLVMPDAGAEFNTLYTANLAWSQQDSGLLHLYTCFAGNTPSSQLMLFGGGNDVLVMVGIQRWQGYWVLAWAFQNKRDSSGYCL